ncbi:MAG: zinc-binding dehydrogenase [Chloroflexota bacterium]
MKALVFKAPKQPLAYEDVSSPTPNNDEVVVDLRAASMNHRDNWMTMGLYPKLTANVISGSCGAGTVNDREVIINPNINWGNDLNYPNQKTYDILGMPINGTFAEQIAVNPDRLVDKPAHLSFEEAAAIPLAGLTAYRALFTKGKATAKTKVLINGIGGGVALFAFQFAVALGANVFVTSSSAEKIAKAVKLGAKGGSNYNDDRWHKQFMKDYGRVDVVIDSAGGEGFASLLKICNPLARIAVYGGTRGLSLLSPQDLFFKEIEISGSTMGNDQEFVNMVNFVNEHKIRPVIDSVFPLADYQKGYDRMQKGEQFGKIVFKIEEKIDES